MDTGCSQYIEQFDTLSSLDNFISSISNNLDFEELEVEYLRSIGMLIPAHATALYLFKPHNPQPIRIAATGVDMDFLSYYEKKGRQIDPLKEWIFKNHLPNQSHLLFGLEGWQLHPVYHIVGSAEIDFAMQCPIISDGELIGTLNFGRNITKGQFTKLELKAITILSQFISLAMTKTIGCNKLSKRQEHFCNAVDKMQQGIVIADKDLNIQYANQTTQRLTANFFGHEQPLTKLSHLIHNNYHRNSKDLETSKLSARFCSVPGWQNGQNLVFIDEIVSPSTLHLLNGIITKREMDVIRLVEIGMTNGDIASKLNISINTVKRHLDNLYCKFNVNTRTELIAKVFRIGNHVNS